MSTKMNHEDNFSVCINDGFACRMAFKYPPRHARHLHVTLDAAQRPPSDVIEARILMVLEAAVLFEGLECLSLPRLMPSHIPNLVTLSHLTVLFIGKVHIFTALHILTMCNTIQNVEFSTILYNVNDPIPPLLNKTQKLGALRKIKIHDTQSHFMDLLCFFSCPNLEILDVSNKRSLASIGERYQWFLSCESAFTEFMIESADNLKELTILDNTYRDPLDLGIAETLHYVFDTKLNRHTALKKLWLPRVTEMPFICTNSKFIRNLLDAFELISQANYAANFPPPAPGSLRVYIHNNNQGGTCTLPRNQHVPLTKEHSTNIIPGGYVFACDLCPEKINNEKSLLAIKVLAESAEFHYDVRIGDSIVLLSGGLRIR